MLEWEDWYTFGDHKEVQPFTRVKYLSIIECPKLLKMLPKDLPCLNNLKIRNCPKLCGMLPKDLPCLNKLKISRCPQFLVEGSSVSFPSLTSIAMNDVPLTSLEAVLEMRSMVDDEVISANTKSKHPSSITSLSIGMIKKLELLPKWVTHGVMEVEELNIRRCEELKTLWKNAARVQHSPPAFRHLRIEDCPQLVSLFEEEWVTHGLMEVEELNIRRCKELKTLWKNEARVQHSLLAFRRLEIEDCPQLVSLFEEDEDEENEGKDQQQQEEGLPSMDKLPRLLHTFTFLRELYVSKCPSLGSFPETGFPCTLKKLKIRDCEALQSLFGWITQINDNNLEVLDVWNCQSLTCLISCRGGGLPHTLKELDIMNCKKLEALLVEEGMEINCPSLESVWISSCDRLKYLPDALPNNNNNLRNLSRLLLYGCKNLEYIPEGWFHSATNLRRLDITGCKKLKALPHGLQSINYLTSFQELSMNISHWNNNFKKIGLHSLSSLKTLSISGEEEEEHPVGSSFPIDGKLLPTSLIVLWIRNFRNLEKLSSKLFQNLASLESLYIRDCPRLKSLPVQRLPPSLNELWIQNCPRLTGKCEKGKGKYWPHLAHIPDQSNCQDMCFQGFEYKERLIPIDFLVCFYFLREPQQMEEFSFLSNLVHLSLAILVENNISLVWSWIESWIAESCLVTLIVQTSHSYWGIMLLAKTFESKQENPSLYTVEMANVESTFDLSSSEGVLDTFLSMNPNSRIHDFFRVLRLKACNLSEKVKVQQVLNDVLQELRASDCKIFGVLDVEKKGKITFKKFLYGSAHAIQQPFSDRRAYELAFAECHTGGNHYISEQELGDSIKPAIPNTDEFEIHELFKSFDTDSSGRINKDDFIACLRRNPLLVALLSPQLMHKNLSRVDDT
ncbi:unnamed protein product [Camellia sinensis]